MEWLSHIKIEPEWKPDLAQSNFDPEYTTLSLDFNDFGFDPDNNERRGKEFWMEGVLDGQIESHFTSRTVTEQSICQSYIETDGKILKILKIYSFSFKNFNKF